MLNMMVFVSTIHSSKMELTVVHALSHALVVLVVHIYALVASILESLTGHLPVYVAMVTMKMRTRSSVWLATRVVRVAKEQLRTTVSLVTMQLAI